MLNQLQAEFLQQAVAEHCDLDMDVRVLATIDSTNSWALQQCKAGVSPPFACFAEEQTGGRGRRDKQWLMTPFSNIAMSLAWPFELSYQELYLLPLSVAVAIARALESYGLQQVQIKWPNDVYVYGKKIAGVLIETRPLNVGPAIVSVQQKAQMAVVIGIGLNYDMTAIADSGIRENIEFTDFCEQLNRQHLNAGITRTEVAARVLQNVVSMCQQYGHLARYYLEVFRTRYDYCRQKTVEVVLDDREVIIGVAQGVTDRAELLVMIGDEVRVYNSADVSVRADSSQAAIEAHFADEDVPRD